MNDRCQEKIKQMPRKNSFDVFARLTGRAAMIAAGDCLLGLLNRCRYGFCSSVYVCVSTFIYSPVLVEAAFFMGEQ